MSSETNNSDDKNLDDWLGELAGNGNGNDPVAERLRQTVLKQQAAAESEVDEMRLRRGRDKLLAEARKQSVPLQKTMQPRLFAVAASVLLVITVGILGYNVMTTPDYELLMSFGELERPRGTFSTMTINVQNPESTGREIGNVLVNNEIPFELIKDDEAIRLSAFAGDDNATEVLALTLGTFGESISTFGYYTIVIEPLP